MNNRIRKVMIGGKFIKMQHMEKIEGVPDVLFPRVGYYFGSSNTAFCEMLSVYNKGNKFYYDKYERVA